MICFVPFETRRPGYRALVVPGANFINFEAPTHRSHCVDSRLCTSVYTALESPCDSGTWKLQFLTEFAPVTTKFVSYSPGPPDVAE